MDLNLIDRFLKTITLPFQSFLTVEIFLIFIILYIFLVYNEKRKNKIVKLSSITLILFFFSLLVFYFKEDIVVVLNEIIKKIIKNLYFPNIIFYILTFIISLITLIYTIISENLVKINKIITYTLCVIHLYLFINFIAFAISNKLSLIDTANIYQHDYMFIIILASQIIFIAFIIYKIIYFTYHKRTEKLKKK